MMLAWRALIPISLVLLIVTSIVVYFFGEPAGDTIAIDGKMAAILLLANVVALVIMMLVSVVLPPPPATNRKVRVPGSRFAKTPLPAGA